MSGIGCRSLASRENWQPGLGTINIQHKALTFTKHTLSLDSSYAPPMHTDTSHTWGCTLGRYENWPQCWLCRGGFKGAVAHLWKVWPPCGPQCPEVKLMTQAYC